MSADLDEFRRKNAALYDETQGELWDAIVYDGIHHGRHFINLGGEQLLTLAMTWGGSHPVSVLDLGTGLGDAAFHWIDHGARVTAVDINEHQLRAARERAEARGSIERLDLVLADINEWVPTQRYDLVTSWDVLMLLPDARAVMRVASDSLAREGTFVASTFFAGPRLTASLRAKLWEEDGMATFLTPAEYTSLAHERGLEMVGYEDLTTLAADNQRRMLTLIERLRVRATSPATLESWHDMAVVYLEALASGQLTYGAFAVRRAAAG